MNNPSENTQLLQIEPVQIPGMVNPVDHPEAHHGGIPLSLASSGYIRLVVDPWLNMSVNDSADALLNESDNSVVNKIIESGEEDKQFTMDLPATLLRDGINSLRLRVTRLNQPVPATSQPLKALYYTPRPGGQVTGSGDNPNLTMTLPAEVIRDGVNAERAKNGVDLRLSYVYMRQHDVITLYRDGRETTYKVTATQAAAGAVVVRLFTNDFWQDNEKFVLRFRVTDQLGNTSGPQAIWSSSSLINVYIRKEPEPELDLLKPKVLEAKESGGTVLNFIKDFYNAEFATVEVNYIGSAPQQTVRVQWLGRNFTYHTDIQTVTAIGQTLRFRIPRLEVIDIIGGSHADITYTVRLPGTTEDITSRDLDLTVTRQKHLLGEPTINTGRTNLRVYYPILEAAYTARMALHGVVTRYSDEVNISQPSSYTDIPIPSAWIAENRGHAVMFNYTLKRTGTDEPLIFSWCLRLTL
ncbi:hypothetical protein [Pseudomonas germanica]